MLVRKGVRIDEDRLTHAVIGLMRYLPPALWFRPFLEELMRRNRKALEVLDTSSKPEIELWPSYPIPDEWKGAFWRPPPRKGDLEVPKESICPDARIETKEWIMLVESEYSHDLEAEQLFQQFAIANHKRDNKEFFVLLINRRLTRPSHCGVDSASREKPEALISREHCVEKYIAECCSCYLKLPFKEKDVEQRLLWINWQSLNGFFKQLRFDEDITCVALPEPFRYMVKMMQSDVCELLKKEGLVPIDYGPAKKPAELQMTANFLPSFEAIKPIVPFLKQLDIYLEATPQWHEYPDILKVLKEWEIRPEYVPACLFGN